MPRGGSRPNTGGKRPGAGRKPGSMWQPKVVEWRAAAAANAAEIIGSSRDPLIYLIDRVFDPTLDVQLRVSCAAIATKYLHPMLSASTVAATHTLVKIDPGELLNRIADRIGKQAQATLEHEPAEAAE